ncbi:MAG: hypothetical protein ACRD2R_07010 [Terriglobales bacterium]
MARRAVPEPPAAFREAPEKDAPAEAQHEPEAAQEIATAAAAPVEEAPPAATAPAPPEEEKSAGGYVALSMIRKDGKLYQPGDAIELSDAEAAQMPWAVKRAEKAGEAG